MSHTVYEGQGLRVGTFHGDIQRGPMVHVEVGSQYTEITIAEWRKIVDGVSAIYSQRDPDDEPRRSARWQFMRMLVLDRDWERRCTELAAQGWRLVAQQQTLSETTDAIQGIYGAPWIPVMASAWVLFLQRELHKSQTEDVMGEEGGD